jgi:BirA family transcriptional regulator, biotin operon repressor / biotin---[acetyl-CoA-carboxylase] ligase
LIDAEEIKKNLHTKIIGKEIFSFDSVDSTNAFAKKLTADKSYDGTLIIAEEQTLGRGRFNRKWESEKEKNLTLSIVLQPYSHIENIGLIPLCTGAMIARSVEHFTKLKTECKWPNDILIDGKKVCGILIESSSTNNIQRRYIIGIGININQETFSADIISTASSLKLISGKDIDRIKLLINILESLEEMYKNFIDGNHKVMIDEWLSRCTLIGKKITVLQSGKEIKGKALKLDNDGNLILDCDGRLLKILSGDVTLTQL